MEHEIPFGKSNRENGPTYLDFPLFLGIFQWDELTKRVPFTAGPEILSSAQGEGGGRNACEIRFQKVITSLCADRPHDLKISERLEQAKNKGKKKKGFLRR